MADWESQMAGERMAVDGEFSERVRDSSLSSQQWNMVMTAVSFEIEAPGTPEGADLVADTSRLPTMMDEIERVGKQGRAAGGDDRSGGGGVLGGLRSALGLGDGGGDGEIRAEAEELAAEYAERLQAKLIERGRWEAICAQAESE